MNEETAVVCVKFRRPKSAILPRYQRNWPDAFVSCKAYRMRKSLLEAWMRGDEEARQEAYDELRETGNYPPNIELYFERPNGGGRPPKFRKRKVRPNEGFRTFDKGML